MTKESEPSPSAQNESPRPANIWRRRLLWMCLIGVAIYYGGRLADYVWFRTQIPLGFQNAN